MGNTENRKDKLRRVLIAAIVISALLGSCAITINNMNHSTGTISTEQNATQKNDSTNYSLDLNK